MSILFAIQIIPYIVYSDEIHINFFFPGHAALVFTCHRGCATYMLFKSRGYLHCQIGSGLLYFVCVNEKREIWVWEALINSNSRLSDLNKSKI